MTQIDANPLVHNVDHDQNQNWGPKQQQYQILWIQLYKTDDNKIRSIHNQVESEKYFTETNRYYPLKLIPAEERNSERHLEMIHQQQNEAFDTKV